jgi:hypothetical protein
MLAISAASSESGAGRHSFIEEPSEEVAVTISRGTALSVVAPQNLQRTT